MKMQGFKNCLTQDEDVGHSNCSTQDEAVGHLKNDADQYFEITLISWG